MHDPVTIPPRIELEDAAEIIFRGRLIGALDLLRQTNPDNARVVSVADVEHDALMATVRRLGCDPDSVELGLGAAVRLLILEARFIGAVDMTSKGLRGDALKRGKRVLRERTEIVGLTLQILGLQPDPVFARANVLLTEARARQEATVSQLETPRRAARSATRCCACATGRCGRGRGCRESTCDA